MPDMMTQEGPSAVYLAARREWNERYGTHISRERWWRAAALLAITANFALSGELAWKAHQSRVVPYVVAVDKLGESVAVHRLPVAPPVDALRIRAQLARWVSDIRSVYSDPLAERNVATEAYEWVDLYSDGKAQLDTWFRSTKPNERARSETVGVSIKSVGQIGQDTYSVDWSEEKRTKDSQPPTTSYWRASIVVKVDPPSDNSKILINPNGVFVTWFNVTPRVR